MHEYRAYVFQQFIYVIVLILVYSMAMAQLQVLISGAGIAGPMLAYWLERAGASVTVVERAPQLRSTGQAVDIRGAAVDIIRQMGLEETVRSKHTTEKGVAFVDSTGYERATFESTGSADVQSFTSEFEILRGDLALLFYDVTKDKVNYIFDEAIQDAQQNGDSVEVTFENRTATTSYNVVVAADGLGSKLRAMAFGTTASKESFRSLGQFCAYFTTKDLLGGSKIAKWYNAPGGRLLFLRPNGKGGNQAYLAVVTKAVEAEQVVRADPEAQKAYLHRLFKDAGWVCPQVLEGMDVADDFYYQAVAQVKMEKWYKGGIVFLGDACYCPSFISGMGTSSAIVGAYMLAGEIMQNPHDLTAAFQSYQKELTPFVDECQRVPPGAPGIVNPQRQIGITILYSILGWVTWLGIDRLITRIAALPAFNKAAFAPPHYEWPS